MARLKVPNWSICTRYKVGHNLFRNRIVGMRFIAEYLHDIDPSLTSSIMFLGDNESSFGKLVLLWSPRGDGRGGRRVTCCKESTVLLWGTNVESTLVDSELTQKFCYTFSNNIEFNITPRLHIAQHTKDRDNSKTKRI